jgi:excisionase family DNA binding protein
METKESEKLVYTIEECSQRLGISKGTAYSLAREGRLPIIRISDRRLIVPKVAIEKMLSEAGKSEAKND